MAISPLKKFRMLEQQQGEERQEKPPEPKPPKKNKLSLYSHILSNFESGESTDEKRRKTVQNVRQREIDKQKREKERLEEEIRIKEEELQLRKKQKEEEERRLKEEEEERQRVEEERKREAEEAARKQKEWEKKEGKYAGLKPAAAMFQRALDAKGSVQKSMSGGDRRVTTLKRGTISEIRSKIFDQKSMEKSKSESQVKPPPKKLIIPSKNCDESKEPTTPDPKMVMSMEKDSIPIPEAQNRKADMLKDKKEEDKQEKKDQKKMPSEPKGEDSPNKRQSFISDFAALEKTYKILGISKEPPKVNEDEETKKNATKKRHNSEGKIKNKDKVKAKRKSVVMSEAESNERKEPKEESPKEAKVDMVLKVQNQANKNFFQENINRKKGLTKEEPELLGPRVRKKGSLINAFEQGSMESDKSKRKSLIGDEVRVDSQKFNSFLNKFESKDGREDARAQMIKITKQQKEFEQQRKLKEQKNLEEKEALRKKIEEEQERAIQNALCEEIAQQQRIEEEDKRARIKAVEEEFTKLEKEEDEAEQKRQNEMEHREKVTKKKKKCRKAEEEPTDAGPKMSILSGDVSNTRSMFERNKKGADEPKEPPRPVRINKLTVNPFENMNSNEQTIDKGVKVNKLKRNSFMEQLEKKGYVSHQDEEKKPAPKAVPPKKISGEACIKFESKKERKPSEEPLDRKPEVRVSKSIEGPPQADKNLKEKKSGSSMSLHKIFIDGPKEFFKSSKEKLYKISKETLCEVNERNEKAESQNAEKKPSRSEMQNYLLSHVLFDGKEVAKKEKPVPAKEEIEDIDDIENYLDDEYRAKIEQYCALLEDDKPKRKKKKKATKAKKPEESLPALKTSEIKQIQEQLQQQLGKPIEKKVGKDTDSVFVKHESQVNKFKDRFDNDPKEDNETKPMLGQKNRKAQHGKSDIFTKIKALENAEKERLERERQNEERIQYLLEKEMERQKENESQQEVEESEEDEAEEELKQNILQCLEDEVDNLEQEMLALDTQEQMIIDEEMDELMSNEKDDENEDEHKVQLHEIHEEIVERKKNAADKKRKVMERFQHVLDANDEEGDRLTGKGNVGKLHDRMNLFNSKSENLGKKGFEDNVFVGVSDVMSKVKDRFEAQEEKQLNLLSRDEIKRKANPSALKFETMTNEEELIMSPAPKKTDWSWKNKTAAELDSELNSYNETETNNSNISTEKKPSRNFQDAKFSELLSDINAVKQRLSERDLERENERKIQEMEDLIDGVKESLKQHEEQYLDNEEDHIESKKTSPARKVSKKKSKCEPVQVPKINKLEGLKNQLMNKDSTAEKPTPKDKTDVDVSVSQIRKKIIEQSYDNEQPNNELEQKTAKRSVSSNIISKLSDILPTEKDKEDDVQLRKAPKMVLKASAIEDKDDAPAKTLEELKSEKETKKWAWKEKDMSDLQNFINANNDVAPKDIIDQQKNLKDLQEELNVVESIQGSNNAAILVQIREEKEREFKEFMAGVKTYLTEDTKTEQEVEFKEGMKSYLDLIDSDKKEGAKKPQPKLNTISKLKSNLLDGPSEISKGKRPSNTHVKKLETRQIEAVTQQADSPKKSLMKENVIAADQTLLVKKLFEDKDKSPNKSPMQEKRSSTRSSFADKFAKKARDDKLKRLEHQLQFKLKTITDLHTYIENNEILATETLMENVRESKIRKEDQKLIYHEQFIDGLNIFLKEQHKSEEQSIFMGNIRAYLTILDNVESTYNATPKLRKHRGSSNQSNIRKAIIEKSVERPKPVEEITPRKEGKKVMSAEEKRKEILSKYGLKDRSKIEVEDISDHDEDAVIEEVNVKELTDRELCEKYHLPYVPDSSDLYQRDRADSASSFTGLLSKIRQANSEKAQAISSTKKIFETNDRHEATKELIKPLPVRLRQRYDSEREETSRGNSPVPSNEPGSRMTDKIKRRFEEHRKSLADDEVDAINTFAQRNGVIKSGSTTKMKKLFESDSPNDGRISSPLLRADPGSLVTSRMKQRFEASTPSSNRQSFIDDESSGESRGCSPMLRAEPASVITSKLRNRFETGAISPVAVKPAFGRGLQKSSTISDIGNALQHSLDPGAEARKQKSNLAEMYFKDKDKVMDKDRNVMSPAVHRAHAIEKSKSFSKFKNAFESGKGLNNDSSDEDEGPVNQKDGINAELEALRSSGQTKSSIDIAKTVVNDSEMKKRDLAASFFNNDKPKSSGLRSQGPVKSTTVSDIGAYLRSAAQEPAKPWDSPKVQTKVLSAGLQQDVKETKVAQSPQLGLQHSSGLRSQGPVKSTTVSDIGAYLRSAAQEPAKPWDSPKVQTKVLSAGLQQDVKETKVAQSPQLGLQHSKSFSKFKNAFEDGKGIMDETEKPYQIVDDAQRRVNAEIAALKSSNKIQNMFRINKSKSSPGQDSPRSERRQSTTDIDLDDDTMIDVAKSRSAIADMFESKGPKMTFGGNGATEKPAEPANPKPAPRKKEDGDMNERKWVFDTIQKYFDVIVEDEEEEKEEDEDEDEDEENDDGDDGDEDNGEESESDYTDAEDELPEIALPPPRERSGTLPTVTPLLQQPKELPRLAVPTVQRASSLRASPHALRASTASPATLPVRRQPERKVSTISIDNCIDDAAKQFDQLTDGSELSLDQSPSLQRCHGLQKSSSSSKIRSMLQSVVHGSNTSLNLSAFKSNLQAHLSNSRAGSRCNSVAPRGSNLDPGVGDDSSSDFSEYD